MKGYRIYAMVEGNKAYLDATLKITDGPGYIWKKQVAAENVIAKCTKYESLAIEPVPDDETKPAQAELSAPAPTDTEEPIQPEEPAENEETKSEEIPEEFFESIRIIAESANQLDGYIDLLVSQLSHDDLAITDMMHYIEFHTMNAATTMHLAKLLKETLKHRREVKNKIQIIQDFRRSTNNSLKQLKNTFHQIETRVYTPRVLDGLFTE